MLLYRVNLMDSPGHVDFSYEVSSALRLSDGALVLIDVVEGVSPQTKTVLKQAWNEKVKTCLVLNKMDRLFLERSLSASEVFNHLKRIIEDVNIVIHGFIQDEESALDEEFKTDEDRGEKEHFSPENGNVAFASSIDSWGFTILDVARKLAPKFKLHPKKLCKVLFGEFYASTNKEGVTNFTTTAQHNGNQTMFETYVISDILKVYHTVFTDEVLNN